MCLYIVRIFNISKMDKKMKNLTILFLVLIIATINIFSQATIRINEVMTSNGWTIKDEYSDNSDWIELYNYGNKPINLRDFRISDRDNFDKAYILPDTIIQPNEYILIWASGKDVHNSNIMSVQGSGFGMYLGNEFSDYGGFVYIPVTGDFEAIVRINDFEAVHKTGYGFFMAREELAPSSRWSGIAVDKYNTTWRGRSLSKNPLESGVWMNFYDMRPYVDYPNCIIKMVRKGNAFYNSFSSDGYLWRETAEDTIPNLNSTIYLGFFVHSNENESYSKMIVSELLINNKEINFDSFQNIDFLNQKPVIKEIYNTIHTDFRLGRTEQVYLWDDNGTQLDYVEWVDAQPDISIGKDSNGENILFDQATPGEPNSQGKSDKLEVPKFSKHTGYCNTPISLEITASQGTTIYYTNDFSEPTVHSLKYSEPIYIENTTIIRAIAVKEGAISSNIVTNSYIYDIEGNLPTISIVASEEQLYNEKTGILYNYIDEKTGEKVEPNLFIPEIAIGNAELFEEDKIVFNAGAGMGLRGIGSRNFPQKSFNMKVGSKFNSSDINEKIFVEKEIDKFSELVCRNSGQDWFQAFIRDPLASVLAHKANLDVDYSGYTACRSYLNGDYYGILNLREKSNHDFIFSNYGYAKEDLVITSSIGAYQLGTTEHFWQLFNKVDFSDTSIDSVFNLTFEEIDMKSFKDYYFLKIFIGDFDWPTNNNKLWKNVKTNSKWRHILYDSDFSMGMHTEPFYFNFNSFIHLLDTTKINMENHPTSTLFFRKAMDNINFRDDFLNRTADLMNHSFKYEHIIMILDSLAEIIAPEIPRHQQRWSESAQNWNEQLDTIKLFFKVRHNSMFDHAVNYYQLPGTQNTFINTYPDNSGLISINSLDYQFDEFEGRYFQTIPITIRARPKDGYKFVRWGGASESSNPVITIVPDSEEINLTALFKEIESNDNDLVINEILYRAEANAMDWFELYNNANYPIDISNWTMKDDNENNIFTFPENTVIAPDGYLVVSQDIEDFATFYSEVENVIGSFGFGLGRDDQVRIWDGFGYLIDSVDYTNKEPWPEAADNTGASLELINPNLDNTLAENWQASHEKLGTPGRVNSVYVSNRNYFEEYFVDDIAFYYNSHTRKLEVFFTASYGGELYLKMYDLNGREQYLKENHIYFSEGYTSLSLDILAIASGTYFVVADIKIDGKFISRTLPIVIIR